MEVETSFEYYEQRVVKKPRCKYPDCNFYAMKLIGQCNSCDNFYCRIHRLPETHKCKNMLELKNKERMKLANKLMSEKTGKRIQT